MTAARADRSHATPPPSGGHAAYHEALAACGRVATEEYRTACKTLEQVAGLVVGLQEGLRRIATGSPRREMGASVESAKRTLRELEQRLEATHFEFGEGFRNSLETKRRHLEQFTVTLFGRTMAGKSTIREALTRGDGSTIGTGRQRTTREVREYEWNLLRVIDTPGFGAYEGEADRGLALSVVDESDLILFLVSSDSFQEESFRAMQAVRDQNKPLLVVLNVKRDLSRGVLLRQFLRDPTCVFVEEDLAGHAARIRRAAEGVLNIREVRIVPIHAQAAFLATRLEDASEADALRRHSRIDDLFEALRDDVIRRGPIRRLQTILDGTINALLDWQGQLSAQAHEVRQGATLLRDKCRELDTRLAAWGRATRDRFAREARAVLRSLRGGVANFVDDCLDSPDVEERWKARVRAGDLDGWLRRQQEATVEELRLLLEEFEKELRVDARLSADLTIQGPQTYDPWDVRRSLKWASAGGAALAGVAACGAWVGAANFWNPVGWVAAGVSVLALGLAWLFDDRETQLQQQKWEATRQLRRQLDLLERRLVAELLRWFESEVERESIARLKADVDWLRDGMFRVSDELADAARRLTRIVEGLNRRLLIRTGECVGSAAREADVLRLARVPGERTKLLWRRGAEDPRFCREVGRALGEWIDGIAEGNKADEVARALTPARVRPGMVQLRNDGATVRVPRAEIGKAIGKGGVNVSLASQLVGLRIQIISED